MFMLNHMIGFGARPARAVPFELAFVDSATSIADTITIPATAAIGDLAVFYDQGTNGNNGVPAKVIPLGWTEIAEATQNTSATDARLNVFYKILASGEPGASISGITSANSTTRAKIMLVFRTTRPIVSVTPSIWLAQSTATAPTNQSIAGASGSIPLVAIAFTGGRAGTNILNTQTPAFSGSASAGTTAYTGYTVFNTAPVDHNVGKSDTGDANLLASGYLQLT